MSRFRSQPGLQRTSDGGSRKWLIGLGAVVALGGGAYLAAREPAPQPIQVDLARAPAPAQPAAAPTAPAAPQSLQIEVTPAPEIPAAGSAIPPAPQVATPSAPPPQARPTAPAPVQVATAPPAAAAPVRRAQPPPRRAEVERAAEPVEDGRQAYARALEDYEANERRAGYRWARQNNVTVRRYCAATEQRTEAFMRGCMDYIRDVFG